MAGLRYNAVVNVIEEIKRAPEFRSAGRVIPDAGVSLAAQQAVKKALSMLPDEYYDQSLGVSMIIGAMEEGKPTLIRYYTPLRPEVLQALKQIDDDDVIRERYSTRYRKYADFRKDDENRAVEIIGRRSAIDRHKETASVADWKEPDSIRFGKRLVGLEADHLVDGQFVGRPITAVTISKDGLQWHDRGACVD